MRNDLDEIKRIVLGEKKSKRYNKILSVGLALAIIAAISGAVWYFLFKNKDNSSDDWDDDDWDDDDWDDDDFDDDDDICECETDSDDFVIEDDKDNESDGKVN